MKIPWLFIIVLVLLLLCITKEKEGYQNNDHNADKPDDKQFYACHDYSHDIPGTTNYKVKSHGIGKPLQGVYSQFLNTYGLRNFDEIFHSPICDGNYRFDNIDDLTVRPIIDATDAKDEEKLVDNEKKLDELGLHNPMYLHGNPQHIGNKITYSDKINELFIKTHHTHDDDVIGRKPIDFKPKIVSCNNIDGINTNFKCPIGKNFKNPDKNCYLNDINSPNSCAKTCCH